MTKYWVLKYSNGISDFYLAPSGAVVPRIVDAEKYQTEDEARNRKGKKALLHFFEPFEIEIDLEKASER